MSMSALAKTTIKPSKEFNVFFSPASLEAYIARIHQIPFLTETEEKILYQRWHFEQDLSAAKRLILSHLRYVVSIAKKYKGYGLQLADLIQEGNIGLMKAVKKFNPTMGVKLVSFAVHWIKAEIHEFILRNWRIVKIATTKAQRKLFFKLNAFKQKFGDDLPRIARETGIKKSIVEQMDARLNCTDIGIDEMIELPDYSQDPAKLIEAQDRVNHKEQLLNALQTLDVRSQTIIQQRWLNTHSHEKTTLDALAKIYKVSVERIRQVEKSALAKLRLLINNN